MLVGVQTMEVYETKGKHNFSECNTENVSICKQEIIV